MCIAERPIKQRHAIRLLIAENNSETTRQCDNPTLFNRPALHDLPYISLSTAKENKEGKVHTFAGVKLDQ